jgi:hypothetical protein
MASIPAAERAAPALCAMGIIPEYIFGFPLYFAVNAVWPNFYYTPIAAGKWTWLGVQGLCIAVYVVGAILAYGSIKRASYAMESRSLATR